MEMKNSVDGLIRGLDTPRKESLSLKTVKIYKIQEPREKKNEKKIEYLKTLGKVTTKGVLYQ